VRTVLTDTVKQFDSGKGAGRGVAELSIGRNQIIYDAFDILAHDSRDLTAAEMLKFVQSRGLEGIVAKQADCCETGRQRLPAGRVYGRNTASTWSRNSSSADMSGKQRDRLLGD
jgi:hypothetical protein